MNKPVIVNPGLAPLRSMNEDVLDATAESFFPKLQPFATSIQSAVDWIELTFDATDQAREQAESSATTATEKAGEASQSAQSASEDANRAEAAIGQLPEGTINDLMVDPNKAWSSQKIDSEINDRISAIPSTADYQEFAYSGTWTRPLGTTFAFAEVWGAGENGGVSAPGEGGNFNSGFLAAEELGDAVQVVVGAAGGESSFGNMRSLTSEAPRIFETLKNGGEGAAAETDSVRYDLTAGGLVTIPAGSSSSTPLVGGGGGKLTPVVSNISGSSSQYLVSRYNYILASKAFSHNGFLYTPCGLYEGMPQTGTTFYRFGYLIVSTKDTPEVITDIIKCPVYMDSGIFYANGKAFSSPYASQIIATSVSDVSIISFDIDNPETHQTYSFPNPISSGYLGTLSGVEYFDGVYYFCFSQLRSTTTTNTGVIVSSVDLISFNVEHQFPLSNPTECTGSGQNESGVFFLVPNYPSSVNTNTKYIYSLDGETWAEQTISGLAVSPIKKSSGEIVIFSPYYSSYWRMRYQKTTDIATLVETTPNDNIGSGGVFSASIDELQDDVFFSVGSTSSSTSSKIYVMNNSGTVSNVYSTSCVSGFLYPYSNNNRVIQLGADVGKAQVCSLDLVTQGASSVESQGFDTSAVRLFYPFSSIGGDGGPAAGGAQSKLITGNNYVNLFGETGTVIESYLETKGGDGIVRVWAW